MTAGDVKRAVLHVRVVPRAARAALTRDQAGRWRAHVTAPPIDGRRKPRAGGAFGGSPGLAETRLRACYGASAGATRSVAVEGASPAEIDTRLGDVVSRV